MYCIAEFDEMDELGTYSVEAFPSIWKINDHGAQWPLTNNSFTLNKLIKQQTPPDDSWTVYKIKSILGYSDTYEEAQEKVKQAEDHTDIDEVTLPTEVNRCERLKKPPKKFQNASSDFLPRPGKIISVVSKPPCKIQNKPTVTNSSNFKNSGTCFSNPKKLSSLQLENKDLQQQCQKKLVDLKINKPEDPLQSTTTVTTTTLQSIQCPNCSTFININLSGYQMKNLRLMESVKQGVQECLEAVMALHTVPTTTSKLSTTVQLDLPVGLPIGSHEQLMMLEEYLNNKHSQGALIEFLSKIGGNDANHLTRNMLKTLISNCLAKDISMEGSKLNKTAFKSLKLRNVIFDAVHKLKPKESMQTVDTYMKNWFKNAKKRYMNSQKYSQMNSPHNIVDNTDGTAILDELYDGTFEIEHEELE